MALVAGHVGVTAGESEMSAGVVVEGGRHPALRIVAIDAMSFSVLGDELRIVGILVARFALLWGAFEARLVTGGGFVAFTASNRAMSANKRELGLGMIEAIHVCPGAHAVAGFAAEGSAIGALASHAIVELTFVRIFVAGSTVAVFKMERKNLVGAATKAGLVAIGTRDSHVRSCQRETRGFVFRNGESGAMEINNSVAVLAAIVVGCGGKLVVVRVLVAIEACAEFHFVDGVLAGGDMALRAFHSDVLALQRIVGGVVFLHAE